ncbi:MAG: hypothetical protein ACXVC6_02895 [Bacteroidia bacterium]
MKKILLLLFAVLTANFTFGQSTSGSDTHDCKDIIRKADKFTGEIKLFTPTGQVSFLKVISERSADYFCNIYEDQDNIFNGKGIVIVLKDGTRISKPTAEVKVDVNTPRFRHSAFFKLTEEDLAQLSKSEITDVKMITIEFSISKGAELQKNLNCLINLK